ncbi:AAA family ATPase [Kutzneria kofuensis]|uniref:NACHT domain-containing protein n=1 Tax=Kutzneria kofuensis TaxID=103725 RepID=A0A7W9KQ86_9PSEU|nr:AAA family ATPase [Kutzneria kofuensis]MBB5896743.1 hypothetical protein [Kutzneria kofuensis]
MILDFTSYLAERAEEFTGREWVLDALAAWRADPAGERFFLIVGEPGAGKTAVAARVAGDADAVHFCSARDRRWIIPRTFAESVSEQLAAAKPAFATALLRHAARNVTIQQTVAGDNAGQMVGVGTLVVDGSADDAFDRLVRTPIEAVTEPVLLLVDGLDESLAYPGSVTIADLVAQSAELPPSVRFVLTCRPLPDLVRMLRRAGARECVLSPREGPGRNLALHDVERYVERLAPDFDFAPELSVPQFVAAVRDRSGGNFLFTRHLLFNLAQQRIPVTRAAITALPRGLDGVYLDFLYRLAGPGQRGRYREIAAVLAVLAVAQQPLDEDHVARFTGLPAVTVRGALTDLRQFLHTDDTLPATTRTYALYHASFAELLLDRDRAEEYWVDGAAAHHAIAVAYLGGDRSHCDDYGLNSLAVHLYEAGDVGPLQSLVDAAWIAERRSRRNDGYDGVLADLDLAWRAAEQADRSAVAAGRPAPYLADELRWALAVASVGTRVLPTALLRELARTGVWSAEQTLGYARLHRSAPDRSETLAALAPVLPEPLRGEAFLEAVATAEGLVAAGTEPAAGRRVAVLAGLIPLLPLDLRRRAVAAALDNARQLSDQRRVAGGNVGHYGSQFGELYRHTGFRSTALDRIAAALAQVGWSDDAAELRRICELPDDAAFGEATAGILARLTDIQSPPPESGDAVTAADVRRQLAEVASEPINDAEMRSATAITLADNRPDPTDPTPAARLDELIRAAPSPYSARDLSAMAAPYQAAALAELAGRLPDDAMAKALDFAERISEPHARRRAIRALGPFLPQSMLRDVIARPGAALLAPLVDVLSDPLLLDALAAVREISDVDSRAAGLAVLAPHLPEPQAGEAVGLLSEWLASTDPAPRGALGAVAGHLPADLAARAFAALRRVARPVNTWSGPDRGSVTAILGLVPHLSEPDRTEALQLIQVAVERGTWRPRSWGFTDAQSPIFAALAAVRAWPPSSDRDHVLRMLVDHAIDQARTARYGRDYETWMLRYRIGLFIVLLPHLPEPHLTEVADIVLRMIVDKSTDTLPADQTAALAAHLPARLLDVAERAITAAPLPRFLPADLLPAALDVARRRGNVDWLFAVAERGLLASCLTVAEEMGGPLLRLEVVTRHAHQLARLPAPELYEVWRATLHGLAGLDRRRFLAHLRDLGPVITALAGPAGRPAVVRAVDAVAAIWP